VQAAGHPGRVRTLELVTQTFYWLQQRKYIHRYVDHCDTYHRIKPIRHVPFGLLKLLDLLHRPWDTITMYFITTLPVSNGQDALWVIIDRLTKMGHFIACKGTMKPEDLADHFIQQVVQHHGLPTSIVSDRGSLFTSDFWKRVTKALGISRNLSTAFHPQTDGQTERVNTVLEQYLRAYCNYQQDDWEKLLPIAEFCYNNMQAGSTKVTPPLRQLRISPQVSTGSQYTKRRNTVSPRICRGAGEASRGTHGGDEGGTNGSDGIGQQGKTPGSRHGTRRQSLAEEKEHPNNATIE